MRRTPKVVAVVFAALLVLWVVSMVTAPRPAGRSGGEQPAPVASATTWTQPAQTGAAAIPTTLPAHPASTPGTQTAAPPAVAPPAETTAPTKPGIATCEKAATALSRALATTGTDTQWVEAMRPVVTGRIESMLTSIDRTQIPAGRASVGAVWDQPGSCDAILQWPGAAWSVTFEDGGAGYLASEWRPA